MNWHKRMLQNRISPKVDPESASLLNASIRLERKHPLAIRWMHWINFPVIFVMVWSGLFIYWNDSDNAYSYPHEIYRIGIGRLTLFHLFPEWFWKLIHAPYHVTQASATTSFSCGSSL